ncbi:MAG: YhgE/Pip domain-containing protein [Bifidobacterium sp.]
MLKAEWKSLLSNRFMIIVLVALALVPGLYQLIFLNSMWDVYGRVSDLPVAVVNNDKAVDFSGKSMNLGAQISDSLISEHSMDVHRVDARQASQGMKDGSYYLAITFPADFSANATSLLTDHPKTLQVDYQTSQGHSFTASKLSASAVEALKNKVSRQITQLYVTQVLKEFGATGKALDNAAEGAGTLQTGEKKISSGSSLIAQNLLKLSQGALQFSDGTQQFSVGAQQYVDAVGTADAGAQQLNAGAGKLNAAGGSLAQGAAKLSSGANSLSAGTSSYTSGVTSLAQGAQTLSENGTQLNAGAQRLSSSLAQGGQTLNAGAENLTGGVRKLDAALTQTPEQQKNIETLVNGLPNTYAAITELNERIQQLPDTSKLTALQQERTQDLQELRDVSMQLAQVQSASQSNASSGNAQPNTSQPNVSQSSTLQSLTQRLQTISKKLSENQNEISRLEQGTAAANDNTDADANANAVAQLKKQAQSLSDGSRPVLFGAASALQGTESGLQSAKQAVDTQLAPGATALQSGVKSYTSGANEGVAQLSTGLNSYTAGVNQLNAGAQKLSANSGTLVLGAQGLAGGLQTVNSNLPQLTGGLASLQQGTSTLANGLQTLHAKGSTLTEAAGKLNSASGTIATGSKELSQAQAQVSSGADAVSNGLGTLSGKLSDGSTSIAKVNTTSHAAQAVSAPVTSKHTDHDKVANNGTGMAPYMISVALFVGTLAINMMYDATIARKKPSSGVAWWASKMSVLGIVAIVQAVLVDLVVVKMLGLQPLNQIQFLGIVTLISLMNMSLVTFFNVLLGKVGAFLMMIFLMVQLGASAGTYPIQLSGGFYQAIHPWIPMTYAIDALRESISIGGSIAAPTLMLLAILAVANVLMILVFARRKGMSSVGFERQEELKSTTMRTAAV